MTLSSGTRLGPHEIVGSLGTGGMGEVYKARDTRLNRTVAIKILHGSTDADQSARARLEREARAISALNHPHICTLYDIGVHEGVDFLVMEYVEGETLAARLTKGPLPVDQALTYASQIVSALDRAHRAGIVHRDIKPSNVMLTRAGVKLLDFGLAKPCAPLPNANGDAFRASADFTQSGAIVGTVQYMSPEQLEGRSIDGRTDIFAFGALLYEMASGRKAFEAGSAASCIAAILERDPPRLTSVQPLAPPALDAIISTCLEKDPDDRWQSAGDLLRALQLTTAFTAVPRTEAPASAKTSPQWTVAAATVAAVVGAMVTLAIMTMRDGPAQTASTLPRDLRFTVYPEHGSVFSTTPASVVAPQFALSPDGTHLAFVATSAGRAMLWVRPLNALQARVLPGTEDADYPFWSADSRSVAFFSQGKLKTVSLAGGTPLVRANASRDPRGGTWGSNGAMLATLMSFGDVMTISATGSVDPASSVNREAGETNHRWPSLLPDGKHFLYVTRSSDKSRRGVTLMGMGEPGGTRLVDSDNAAAVADGRLLFVRGRVLMAQALDVPNRRLIGEPVALVNDIATNTTGYSAFSVSDAGVLAYASTWPAVGELTWFARDGRQLGAPVAPLADYVSFALSPDARRLAVSRVDVQTSTPDIWLLDPTRGLNERLTSDPLTDANAFWATDGSRIVFRSNRTGVNRIYARGVNDTRNEELIDNDIQHEDIANMILTDFSRDGAHLLLTNTGRATSFDIWWISQGKAKPIVQTEFDEYQAVLSPDNRWMALVSNESGVPQVYVQSFPSGNQRWQVSSHGGTEPQWRRDGQELFFLTREQTLTAVPVSFTPAFSAGLPTPLFRTRVPVSANPYRQQYAVSPDGQRFLVNTAPESNPPPAIHVVLDWRALLESARK